MECAACHRHVPDAYVQEVDGVAYCVDHAVASLAREPEGDHEDGADSGEPREVGDD